MSAEMGGRARGAGIGRAHLVVQQEPVRVRLVRADVLVRCTIVARVSMVAGHEEWAALARVLTFVDLRVGEVGHDGRKTFNRGPRTKTK